jgi:hypothetical protein
MNLPQMIISSKPKSTQAILITHADLFKTFQVDLIALIREIIILQKNGNFSEDTIMKYPYWRFEQVIIEYNKILEKEEADRKKQEEEDKKNSQMPKMPSMPKPPSMSGFKK